MPNNHSTLSSLIVKDRLQQLKSSISTKPLGQSFYKSSAKGWEQTQKETLKHGGVYAFWWATETDYFRRLINRSNGVKLYGKQLNGKPLPVNIQINEQWLEDARFLQNKHWNKFLKTLSNWMDYILNYAELRITNAAN